jgi:uncharacterized protein (DUF58 family)
MTMRPRAILWLGLIAVLGVAGVWSGGALNWLWRIAAAIGVVCFFLEYLLVRTMQLRVRLHAQNIARLGRTCEWRLEVINLASRRLTIRYAPLPPQPLSGPVNTAAANLDPSGRTETHLSLVADQLGHWRWPPQPVEIKGVFGLAGWIRSFEPEDGDAPSFNQPADLGFVTQVEPDMLAVANRDIANQSLGQRVVSLRDTSGSEFHTLRPYVPGDASNLINWKATARARKLIVQEAQMEQQLLLYFVIDQGQSSALRTNHLSTLGHAVNLTARLAELANNAGDRYGLMCFSDQPGQQLEPGRGVKHHRRFREILGSLSSVPVQSNTLAAAMAIQQTLPRRALVLFFANLDDADAGGQLLQATRLLRQRHLPLIVAVEDRGIRETMAQRVQTNEQLFSTLAAQEYRRSVQHAKEQLERLGAIVVESPPELVEEAVFERYKTLRARHQI